MIRGPDYGGTQDRGRRPYQEDSFHLQRLPGANGEPEGLLMAMADGMGGHVGGAKASAVAIESFVQAYVDGSEPEADRLHGALLAANQRIAREIDAEPALRGMGCTLVGASLTLAGLHLVSVGDSLAFLFRNGELTRLNADHSMSPVLRQAVEMGTLSREEMACHPHRNALRSAVMGEELGLVDLRREPVSLMPGDKLIVASDGILTLPEDRIVALLGDRADRTAEEMSELLVEAVTGVGDPHQDNVTVLVAALPAPEVTTTDQRARSAPRPAADGLWAATRNLMVKPRVLATLGAGFLLAAVLVGAGSTVLRSHESTSSQAVTPLPEAVVSGNGGSAGHANDPGLARAAETGNGARAAAVDLSAGNGAKQSDRSDAGSAP